MKLTSIALAAAAVCAVLVFNTGAAVADTARPHAVAGEKLDSGLGELPPYGQVKGGKLDSGLGDLPHYRHWADKTGRDPMGKQHFAQNSRKRQ